ncbi:hypothetical protein AB1Y20_007799 [Prymnesium parvum]|uniref:Uncharacterized protein n=1 Tax=Prymnesium parvum TaxID=97485 RepID=A0AB34ISW2_PRYPA
MQRVLSSRPAVSPSAAKGPQAAPSLSPSRTSPTRLAHSWSASAWSSGAPSAVHTAPPPPAAAHTPPPPLLSTPTGRGDPPPQPRGSTPQPFSAHRRVVCHAPPPVDPMPPPRETTREKRLQQQRDALSYALSLAQAATGEEALRAELLRSELAQADATLQHVTTMIRSGRAESGMLKQQLDAMAAELGATRAELHRHQSHRPAASGSCSRMTARAAAPRAASVARRGARDAAVKPLASRAAHAASTQTDASVKDDRELEALSRTQAAELSGLREIDGREQAHAAAITAHGTSALHARLLWGETHALESHVAELSAELTKERQQHSRIQAAREVEVSELRATLAALRAEHEKVVELEEKKAALLKEQKEKGRLLRSKEEISQEQATRIADLERSLAQTRGVLKQHKETARQAAEQARADREVLAGCVQQMTDQLAAANAAKDSTHSNLVSFQEEMSERLHETERQLRESRHACETLQAQLIECERQLQLEVDGSHGQREEWEDALRSATARIDELESMLQETHGQVHIAQQSHDPTLQDLDTPLFINCITFDARWPCAIDQAQTRLEALDDSHLRAKEAAALADEMEQEASEAEQRLAARDSALETLRAEADIRTELLSSMMLHSRASFERDAATIRVLCASLAESEVRELLA